LKDASRDLVESFITQLAAAAKEDRDQSPAPALQPGRYFLRLWIPNPDPALKFDPARNLLLSNEGVPEPKSGLNRIATISVEDSGTANSRKNR